MSKVIYNTLNGSMLFSRTAPRLIRLMIKDAADGSRTIASSARRCRMIVSESMIASLGNPGRPPRDPDSGHRRTRRCQSGPLRHVYLMRQFDLIQYVNL